MRSQGEGMNVRRVSISGMLVALGVVFGYVDSILPVFYYVPGMKIGLGNLVVILALYMLGSSYALLINIVRILLSAMLFGGFSGFVYSLAGGALSFAAMLLMKKMGFNHISVSVSGGIAHNVGQIVVAMIILNTVQIAYYMMALFVSGLISGALIGGIAAYTEVRLKPVTDKYLYGDNVR